MGHLYLKKFTALYTGAPGNKIATKTDRNDTVFISFHSYWNSYTAISMQTTYKLYISNQFPNRTFQKEFIE